jgi:aminoglycoside/choline kinase family phosphotransferase
VKLAEAFGPDLYGWEHNYFLENFVRQLCGIGLERRMRRQIETELSVLAQKLSSDTRNLVHRDLQSQNVMLCQGEPFLIDFQGMRFGTRFYDLGSLLCDPYVRISEREREALLMDYYRLSEQDRNWDSFRKSFWEASSQRLMQALGAYSYLGLAMGLKKYLAHIPAGLGNLRMAAGNAISLPGLLELCTECERVLPDRLDP